MIEKITSTISHYSTPDRQTNEPVKADSAYSFLEDHSSPTNQNTSEKNPKDLALKHSIKAGPGEAQAPLNNIGSDIFLQQAQKSPGSNGEPSRTLVSLPDPGINTFRSPYSSSLDGNDVASMDVMTKMTSYAINTLSYKENKYVFASDSVSRLVEKAAFNQKDSIGKMELNIRLISLPSVANGTINAVVLGYKNIEADAQVKKVQQSTPSHSPMAFSELLKRKVTIVSKNGSIDVFIRDYSTHQTKDAVTQILKSFNQPIARLVVNGKETSIT